MPARLGPSVRPPVGPPTCSARAECRPAGTSPCPPWPSAPLLCPCTSAWRISREEVHTWPACLPDNQRRTSHRPARGSSPTVASFSRESSSRRWEEARSAESFGSYGAHRHQICSPLSTPGILSRAVRHRPRGDRKTAPEGTPPAAPRPSRPSLAPTTIPGRTLRELEPAPPLGFSGRYNGRCAHARAPETASNGNVSAHASSYLYDGRRNR
mmetsp:Transcript_23193/g.64399  ORF Transcript_23193/g.64399 Transcript_23193/m.64399 type:complete len:212 (+) Transcript_23193:1665-2300(+)